MVLNVKIILQKKKHNEKLIKRFVCDWWIEWRRVAIKDKKILKKSKITKKSLIENMDGGERP